MKPLAWVTLSRDFFRSAGSRFDVMRAAWSGLWVAVDADAGSVRRFATMAEAVAWCEDRVSGKRVAA